MKHRAVLFFLLTIVAAAAAVLSFAALRDLALICGFSPQLAWLLPVTVDAGAAAGSIVWLSRTARRDAEVFARALALTLLALSVAANAVGHGLAAFNLSPAWWVVVIVSAIAPSVLGAVVHLAVLVGRLDATQPIDEGSTNEQSTAGEPGDDEFVLPDRRGHVDTESLAAICDDLRAIAVEAGRPLTQDEVRAIYGIGAEKAGKARRTLGWWPRAVEQSDQAKALTR